MNKLPSTTQRVPMHTCPKINTDIRNRAIAEVYTIQDDPNAVNQKIAQLNAEWDTERVLELGAGSLAVLGTVMGFRSRWWFLLAGFAGIFLLQHALQGWSPSLPLMRKAGVRTAEEIHNEKTALKVLRNDFAQNTGDPKQLMAMVEQQ